MDASHIDIDSAFNGKIQCSVVCIFESSTLQINTSSYCLCIVHEKERDLSALCEHM